MGGCERIVYEAPATAALLSGVLRTLFARFGKVDWVDVDVQGAEDCLLEVEELPRVRHLFVGTHSRELHARLRRRLGEKGLRIEFDFPNAALSRTPIGLVPFLDGILAGTFA